MRGYRVTTVWDIPIRVHVSLLIVLPVLAWLIGSGSQIELYTSIVNDLSGTALDPDVLTAGTTPWLIGSTAAVGLFVSVALHELGHSYVALRYGLEVESITLWILGGLASLTTFPKEWNRELWIAIAGPAVSLAVGAACLTGVAVLPASAPATTFVLGWLGVTNLILAGFNLLPAFPMDGGRVLRALLARNRPYVRATQIAARVGSLFAILFAVVGVLAFSPMLLLLALFIYGAATTESRAVVLSELLSDLTVGELTADGATTVDAGASIDELVTRMFADRHTEFVVTEDGAVVGVVTSADFQALSPEERATTTVASLVERDLPRVAADMPAFDALIALDTSRASAALVDGPDGPHVVTRTDFTDALALRRALGSGEPF